MYFLTTFSDWHCVLVREPTYISVMFSFSTITEILLFLVLVLLTKTTSLLSSPHMILILGVNWYLPHTRSRLPRSPVREWGVERWGLRRRRREEMTIHWLQPSGQREETWSQQRLATVLWRPGREMCSQSEAIWISFYPVHMTVILKTIRARGSCPVFSLLCSAQHEIQHITYRLLLKVTCCCWG